MQRGNRPTKQGSPTTTYRMLEIYRDMLQAAIVEIAKRDKQIENLKSSLRSREQEILGVFDEEGTDDAES